MVAARRVEVRGKRGVEEVTDPEATMAVVVVGGEGISEVGIGAQTVGGVDVVSVQRESGSTFDFGPVLTRTTRLLSFELGAKTPW